MPEFCYDSTVELHLAWYVIIFVLGLCFGSFFNVAIYRWPHEDPKEHEWVKTPSHCPKCGSKIRWFDNIPLVSYLILLQGKCRDCKAPISLRYPIVELVTALLWVLTTWLVTHVGHSGVALSQITGWHIVISLLVASFYLLTFIIDLETQTIPDEILVGHGVTAILYLFVCHGATVSPGWLASLIGLAALALIFFLLSVPEWMGEGDIYLVAGFGILFGWKLGLTSVFLGIVLGGIFGAFLIIYLLIRGRYKGKTMVPFGPFLVLAAYVCLFYGGPILDWYLGFFRPPDGASGVLPYLLPGV